MKLFSLLLTLIFTSFSLFAQDKTLKEIDIPAEMHIFQQGGHGFGMTKKKLPVDQWPELFFNWLKAQKIVK